MGRQTAWLCICDCGNKKAVPSWNLVSNQTKSCGCTRADVEKVREQSKTHGHSYTRLYTIWIGMKQRCYYENHKYYKHYGGRGIEVCDEWKNYFEAFHEWSMTNGYTEKMTIDRIDVNGDYSPQNCRWANYKQQGNNRRNNRLLTCNGETHTLSEWSEMTGIPRNTIRNRIFEYGMTVEEALQTKGS